MISVTIWSLLICLLLGLELVKTQYPMYPMPAPPMYPGPMPIAMPMPVGGVAIPVNPVRLKKRPDKCRTKCPRTTTTTCRPTTSEESSDELPPFPPMPFLPMPAMPAMPMPMPIMLPAPLPKPKRPSSSSASCETSREYKKKHVCKPACPPCQCKPSCTPAFFSYCSPCHQRCKCRSGRHGNTYSSELRSGNGMLPNPVGMPPPPVVAIPIAANIVKPNRRASSDESSSYYSSSSSSESSYPVKRRRSRKARHRKNHKRYYRRHNDVSEENEIGDFARPLLSYISKDGDIKIEKRISKDEAAELLGDKSFQSVNIVAGEDSDNKARILVRSKDKQNMVHSAKRRQVVLGRGGSQHVLGEGKKELVFRPPHDKKISNLTVSFQIT